MSAKVCNNECLISYLSPINVYTISIILYYIFNNKFVWLIVMFLTINWQIMINIIIILYKKIVLGFFVLLLYFLSYRSVERMHDIIIFIVS